jgi:acyl carrier protein
MDDFEKSLAEVLEVDSLSSNDELENFECWDSLTVLSIIALVDEKFGLNLSGMEVAGAKTIGGLKELIKSKAK